MSDQGIGFAIERARAPVEEEAPEVRRVPWVTLGLAVLLTLLSAALLDAGLYHLLTNVYFLFVFGDNVEDRLGRLRFVAYYLLTGTVEGDDTGFVIYGQTRLRQGVLKDAKVARLDGQYASVQLNPNLPANSSSPRLGT